MKHVAIDLGGRESQICVRSADGRILEEERCSTLGLKKYLTSLEPARIVLETCAEAFTVADWASGAGHQVTVVPASLARALGVGARGLKNDVRDARNLSEASCRMERLPHVHIPRVASRELKSLCSLRDSLVGARTKLINCARGWLRGQGVGNVKPGDADRFTRRLRRLWEEKLRQELPPAVQRQVAAIDLLTSQMAVAETEMQKFAEEDPVCRRLMTVPGVGALVAVSFYCAIDDVGRFPTAHALQSYLGLTPGENSSSEKKRRTGITKAGAARVRWMLQQAAWTAWRCRRNHPVIEWAEGVANRRGRNVAATALARKLAGILFAIWRDGTTYEPFHVQPPEHLRSEHQELDPTMS
jgi:transposase